MTTMIIEVYNAFRKAGVPDADAEAAAKAVLPAEQAATKDDLRVATAELKAAIAALKSEIYRALWVQGGAIIGILAGIETLLKIWPR